MIFSLMMQHRLHLNSLFSIFFIMFIKYTKKIVLLAMLVSIDGQEGMFRGIFVFLMLVSSFYSTESLLCRNFSSAHLLTSNRIW